MFGDWGELLCSWPTDFVVPLESRGIMLAFGRSEIKRGRGKRLLQGGCIKQNKFHVSATTTIDALNLSAIRWAPSIWCTSSMATTAITRP